MRSSADKVDDLARLSKFCKLFSESAIGGQSALTRVIDQIAEVP